MIEQAFVVPAFLVDRICAARGTKIIQDPWRHSNIVVGHVFHHRDLFFIIPLLVFFTPTGKRVRVKTTERFCSGLTEEKWLVVFHFPFRGAAVAGKSAVPSKVFVYGN